MTDIPSEPPPSYTPPRYIRSDQNPFEVSVDLMRQSLAIIYHYQRQDDYIPTAYDMQALHHLCSLASHMKSDIVTACRQIEQRYQEVPGVVVRMEEDGEE